VFDELGLTAPGAAWRSLLESEAFRQLLDDEAPPLAKAA
jgi:hypothetical protein